MNVIEINAIHHFMLDISQTLMSSKNWSNDSLAINVKCQYKVVFGQYKVVAYVF